MNTSHGEPRLIDHVPMAELLGISERHLFNLVKAQRVPCIKVGRRRKYDPSDVIEALKRQSMEGCV